jgi:hypothetical protein
MVQFFGRVDVERLRRGSLFPCPACGDVRRYDVVRTRPTFRLFGVSVVRLGRRVESMRCQTCAATYEPMVDGHLNLRQVADWNHRVARLVATVGVVAGPGRPADHQVVAHTFLLRRGWFAGEADAIVVAASELSDVALPGLVEELAVALDTLRSVTRPRGMELTLFGLAAILAAGGTVDQRSEQILVRCADAGGVGLEPIAEFLGVTRAARDVVAA